ncbi:phytochelatin synthase family protein [Oscillatoria salina]|uniref:phytochelatin synthase family protein n=1 Tax=Oscillatoria salina TaxID=331517 RepID=UPI001CCF3118|nr:phytochelatin synthase family protein [Oscillatoria salina]MBZ8180870.1 glutathione gamma-glutamylcysteinyltransferase [Oscillatoria salina IIICB1]
MSASSTSNFLRKLFERIPLPVAIIIGVWAANGVLLPLYLQKWNSSSQSQVEVDSSALLEIDKGQQVPAVREKLPLTENLINFNSTAGEKLLFESEARADYLPLSIHFVTQTNQAFCGVASMVMVLNALDIPAPEAPEYKPYDIFTQKNFFNKQTDKIISAKKVSRQGLTLAELAGLLATYPVKTEVHHGGDLTLDEFRSLIVNNLGQTDNFVIVNYLRKAIGQETGGHISPIAAYDKDTDRLLILDVSRYKYPPVWVETEELWLATRTLDSVSNKTRGLVLVSDR